jgi:MarR family transcriptional regulator, organic hydroperoxide resistance regulator
LNENSFEFQQVFASAILKPTPVVVNGTPRSRKKAATTPAAPPPGVGYFVREASRSYARALQLVFVQHGVTLPQFFYLRVLWNGDGISQATLCAQIGVDRATASFVLTTMEKQGMIVRQTDPSDLRKTNIFLTPLGRRLRVPLLRVANGVNASATRGMTASEVDRLRAALETIVANLQAPG